VSGRPILTRGRDVRDGHFKKGWEARGTPTRKGRELPVGKLTQKHCPLSGLARGKGVCSLMLKKERDWGRKRKKKGGSDV